MLKDLCSFFRQRHLELVELVAQVVVVKRLRAPLAVRNFYKDFNAGMNMFVWVVEVVEWVEWVEWVGWVGLRLLLL